MPHRADESQDGRRHRTQAECAPKAKERRQGRLEKHIQPFEKFFRFGPGRRGKVDDSFIAELDALYGQNCDVCGGFANAAEHKVLFNPDVLMQGLQAIFDGFDVLDDIQPDIFRETLRLFNLAAAKGISESHNEDAVTDEFLEQIRHNNEVFSAFRTHRMQNDIAAQLIDADGHLKSWDKFRRDVAPLTGKYCKTWLNTEYNTAVIRAHRAADWKHFVNEQDVYPNLRWMPTTSVTPDPVHEEFWRKKLTLPVNDPFWGRHHPGERWGCKCTCEQTDEPVNDLGLSANAKDTANKGLKGNPGETGQLFSEDHPYYPKNCGECPFNKGVKNRLKGYFNEGKDCSSCMAISPRIDMLKSSIPNVKENNFPPEVSTYTQDYKVKTVFISPYHGAEEIQENKRIARFISQKLHQKVYLLPRIDSNTPEQLKMRKRLIPDGVIDKKNPDFFIGGRTFDCKSMLGIEKCDSSKIKRKIQLRIKDALSQAEGAILEIPHFIERSDIHASIKGYLSNCTGNHTIIVKWRDKWYN